MLQFFVSSQPSQLLKTLPHFSIEKSWLAHRDKPYHKKYYNKALQYLISDIKAAITDSPSQYLFLDAPLLTRKERAFLYRIFAPLTTIHISYEVLPAQIKDGTFKLHDELLQQIPKIGVDCDEYSLLGPDFFKDAPDLTKIHSLDQLRPFVADDWLPEFDACFAPHETPHHLEDIDQHMQMAHELALKIAPELATTGLLHDLGKGLAKKIDDEQIARFVGHEYRGASLVLLMSRQLPGLLLESVPENIHQHMRAHHGISDKVIHRERLSKTDLTRFEKFAQIDSSAKENEIKHD